MNFIGILYLLLLALAITAIFSYGFGARGPWGSFWAFFIILFFGIWAADAWITPVGPYWGEVYWIPPLASGLLIALILAAATPSPKTRAELEASEKLSDNEETAAVAIGSFFWIVLVMLFAAIIAGIFMS